MHARTLRVLHFSAFILNQCWSLGSCPKKKRVFEEYVPAASLVVYGKAERLSHSHRHALRNSKDHPCIPSVFAIMVGGVNFTNFGTASTTEKEPCGRNQRPVNTFFSYSNIL